MTCEGRALCRAVVLFAAVALIPGCGRAPAVTAADLERQLLGQLGESQSLASIRLEPTKGPELEYQGTATTKDGHRLEIRVKVEGGMIEYRGGGLRSESEESKAPDGGATLELSQSSRAFSGKFKARTE